MEPFPNYKRTNFMILLITLVSVYELSAVDTHHARFYGGSMSFEVAKGVDDYMANIKILTAWKIGFGPCGHTCKYGDIGNSTKSNRDVVIRNRGGDYFGNWSGERQIKLFNVNQKILPKYVDMQSEVNNNITEKVQLVNEKLGWEMEQAEIVVRVQNDTDYIDVKFKGHYWVHTTYKQKGLEGEKRMPWFLQVKIRTSVRSDTQRSNRSPVLQIKPYYRLVLGNTSYFQITYIDQDNDIVKCEKAGVGTSGGITSPDGFEIKGDCKIEFFVDPNKYRLNDTGIALIDVMDFNKNDMVLGSGEHTQRFAGNNLHSRSLSSIPYQFYFEVVDHLDSPVFIDPTPKHNRLFEIYTGAKFSILIVARPTNPDINVQIDRFFFLRRDGIEVITDSLTKMTDIDPRAKGQNVTWTPNPSEIGNHALCSNVIDTEGEESFALHCFVITVKEMEQKTNTPLTGQPYFLHFPSDGDISCQVESICRFPVYAKTDNAGGITNISITDSEVIGLHIDGKIIQAPSRIDNNASMVEVSFHDTRYGQKKFCIKASDQRKFTIQCTYLHVKPRDPCLSSPCHNSGECIPRDDGTFQCVCTLKGTTGQLCEETLDRCANVECRNGGTCFQGFCECVQGITGTVCENVLSVCHSNACSHHGMCIDKPGQQPDHICHCTDFYSGSDCSIPPPSNNCSLIPSHPDCNKCPLNHCNTGKCIRTTTGYSCICPEGFVGQNCETEIDHTRTNLSAKFVFPTLAPGTEVTCDPLSLTGLITAQCSFPVFVHWVNKTRSIKPVVEPNLLSEGIQLDRSSKARLQYWNLFSVMGFTNTYTWNMVFTSPPGLNQLEIGTYHTCFSVKQGNVETDHRCFNIKIEAQVLKLPGDMKLVSDGRSFEYATLPDRSEIICVKNTTCYIDIYTTYQSNKCLDPVFASTDPCTVFGPMPMEFGKTQTFCHSTIVYITDNIPVGKEKEFCIQASMNGKTRCFIIHVVAKSVDPCAQNPCKNDGVCIAYLDGTHSCICQKRFSGSNCEIGTCPEPVGHQYCKNDGHCHTDGIKKSCYCRLGTEGIHCETKHQHNKTGPGEAEFSGSSIPSLIECHLGEPCHIPSVLTGEPNQKPVITNGFVSSGLLVNGMEVTRDKNTTQIYHTVTTVLPKETGLQKLCVQSLSPVQKETVDEVCYKVHVSSEPFKPVSVKKPKFISPTLTDGSYIECTVGQPCHLKLWMKNHGLNSDCPEVISDQNAQDGVYMFQNEAQQSPCSVDVSFHSEIETTFQSCFLLTTIENAGFGGDGEKRCYHIVINKTISHGPCSNLRCKNGGFCNGKGSTGFCQCSSGYSGTHCEISHGNVLTNPQSGTKPKFGDHVIPEKVVCVLHEECSVPLGITSSTNKISLRPGHIDQGLTTKELIVTPNQPNPDTSMSSLKLVGTTPGQHKACVQTGDVGNTNDEVCFIVEVKPPESSHHKIKKSQPYFIDPTITHDSVTQCVPGKSCHILMFMSGGVYPTCPSIKHVEGPSEDLHLFLSKDNDKVVGNCTADVTLTPPSGSTGKFRFCFNTYLPNVPGETRCFYVKYQSYTDPSPTCKGHDCLNEGVCDIITGRPECICSLLQTGSQCEQAGSTGSAQSVPQPKLTDFPLPKVVKCEVGKTCQIPMLVTAGPDKTVTPTVTSETIGTSNITKNPPVITKESKYPEGTYKVTVPVTATTEGLHNVCVNVQPTNRKHCFKVEAFTNPTPTPTTMTNGQFVEPSLNPDSTVVCEPESTCHLVVYQNPNGSKCNAVKGQLVPGGAHIITPTVPNSNGLCETDVVYKPTTGAKSQRICVKAMEDNGNDGETRCFKVDPSMTDIDPCSTVNCNNGECVVVKEEPVCKCHIGTAGKFCHQDTTNVITGNSMTKPAFVDTVKPKKLICTEHECGFPVAVINEGGKSPVLQIQHSTSNLNLTTTLIPGTNTSQVTIPVTFGSKGQASRSVCVDLLGQQTGLVIDTMCYEVEKGPQWGQTVSPFTMNTMGPNSQVSCKTGVACHLIIETYKEGGNCSKINTSSSDQSKHISDVYVFKPEESTIVYQTNIKAVCQTDIAITPTKGEIGEKEICVQIDKMSPNADDKRCYKVMVTKGDACLPVQCLNNGVCEVVDRQEDVAVCICPPGYSGDRCQNAHGNPLTPLKEEEIPNEEKQKGTPKFVETSLPETITCVRNRPCHLPLKIIDPTGQKPSVVFGQVDPGIITQPSKVTTDGNNEYTTDVVITPTIIGKRKVCVQTKNDDGINIDEICYNIETKGSQEKSNLHPAFKEPTIGDQSIVECQPGLTCQIPLTYEETSGKCENVTEIEHTEGVHVFPTTNPTAGQTCEVNVAYKPKPDQEGTKQICLRPGSTGEKRCIIVKAKDTSSSSSTPCQTHHCHRDGFCAASSGSQAVCTCKLGSSGPMCKTDSTESVITGSQGPEPKFVDTAIPREIKCYKNQTCTIPFTVKGNSTPTVGDKDIGLNPMIQPGQKIEPSNEVYQHKLTVTPNTEGKKSICVKADSSGVNKEQICFTVDVVEPPTPASKSPNFNGLTLGPGSTVDCQAESLCHIQVQTEQENGKCPPVQKVTDETSIFDVHLFPPEGTSCTTDVAVKPTLTETGQKQVCLQIKAKPNSYNKRCFTVSVANKKDPCIPVYCKNNGECEETTGQCVCPAGFTGDKCQTQKAEKMTPVDLTCVSPEQPHFVSNAVPKVIKCVQDVPCHVPLSVTEPNQNGQKPTVKYGKVSPGVDTQTPVLTPVPGTKDYTTDVVVTPQHPGNQTVCVQTQTSHGVNVDEICYMIETSGTKPTPTGNPQYTHPTVTDSSTLICDIGHVCHIPLTYKGLKGTCEPINELPRHEDGVYIFKPPIQPTSTDGTCTTDVTYKPTKNGTTELCFKPGSYGEKRCIHIETKNRQELYTPCQSLHCTKGGDCISEDSNAKCVCPIGTTGHDCSEEPHNSITNRTNKNKPSFTDTVLPQEIVCYKGEKCTIPFVVSTNVTMPTVIKGNISSDLSPQGPSTPVKVNNTNSYQTELTLIPGTNGQKEACVKTQLAGSMVDELCVKVKVTDRPSTSSTMSPKFTDKTLNPGSVIACTVNYYCHLKVETTQKPDGKCPTVSKDTSTTSLTEVHPMTTQSDNGFCQTDVVLHPTKTETPLKEICIQINVRESENRRCYQLNVTESGERPPGASCTKTSQCVVNAECNTSKCICKDGYYDSDFNNSNVGGTCLKEHELGQTCSQNGQPTECSDRNAMCSNSSFTSILKCLCPTGFYADGTLCVPEKALGENCTQVNTSLECNGQHTICKTNGSILKCLCDAGSYDENFGSGGGRCVLEKKLGETCTQNGTSTECNGNNVVCGKNSSTSNLMCLCNTGFYDDKFGASGGKCVPEKKLGETCTQNGTSTECNGNDVVCGKNSSTSSLMCLCNTGFYNDKFGASGGKCVQEKKLGETCTQNGTSTECNGNDVVCGKSSSTSGLMCLCNTGFYDDNFGVSGGKCIPEKKLGDTCTKNGTSTECNGNDVVCGKNSSTSSLMCLCSTGFYDDNFGASGGKCVPEKKLGETCTQNGTSTECNGNDVVCGKNSSTSSLMCLCNTGFYNDKFGASGGKCVPEKKLGETCTQNGTSTECNGNDVVCGKNSSTSSLMCLCNTGFYNDKFGASGGKCVPEKKLGETCTQNGTSTECNGNDVVCGKNSSTSGLMCLCDTGFYNDKFGASDGKCVPEPTTTTTGTTLTTTLGMTTQQTRLGTTTQQTTSGTTTQQTTSGMATPQTTITPKTAPQETTITPKTAPQETTIIPRTVTQQPTLGMAAKQTTITSGTQQTTPKIATFITTPGTSTQTTTTTSGMATKQTTITSRTVAQQTTPVMTTKQTTITSGASTKPTTPVAATQPTTPGAATQPTSPGAATQLTTPGMATKQTTITSGTATQPTTPGMTTKQTSISPGTATQPTTPGMTTKQTTITSGTATQPTTPGMTTKQTSITPGTATQPTTPGMTTKQTTITPGTATQPTTPGAATQLKTPGMTTKQTTITPGAATQKTGPGTQQTTPVMTTKQTTTATATHATTTPGAATQPTTPGAATLPTTPGAATQPTTPGTTTNQTTIEARTATKQTTTLRAATQQTTPGTATQQTTPGLSRQPTTTPGAATQPTTPGMTTKQTTITAGTATKQTTTLEMTTKLTRPGIRLKLSTPGNATTPTTTLTSTIKLTTTSDIATQKTTPLTLTQPTTTESTALQQTIKSDSATRPGTATGSTTTLNKATPMDEVVNQAQGSSTTASATTTTTDTTTKPTNSTTTTTASATKTTNSTTTTTDSATKTAAHTTPPTDTTTPPTDTTTTTASATTTAARTTTTTDSATKTAAHTTTTTDTTTTTPTISISSKTKGQCSQITPLAAIEAAKMGRVTCTCIVDGVEKEIIRQNPKATTEQLLKAAGIGAGSVSGAMVIAWVIYMLVSKVKSSKSNLPPTPRPRPRKIMPFRRKSADLYFT